MCALFARARRVDFLPEDLSPWDLRTRFKALAEGPFRVLRPADCPSPIAGVTEFPAGVVPCILF